MNKQFVLPKPSKNTFFTDFHIQFYDVLIDEFDLEINFIIVRKNLSTGDVNIELGATSDSKKVIWRCQFETEEGTFITKSLFAEKSKRMFRQIKNFLND